MFLKHKRKLIKVNRSGYNERRLYAVEDGSYEVEIETYDWIKKTYEKVLKLQFGLFSEALSCVNFNK